MNPIRVLHVVNVEKQNYYLTNLVDHTDGREINYSFVTFASEKSDFYLDFKERGFDVYGLDCMPRTSYLRAAWQLWKLMRKLDPHIVNTHLFDPTLIGLTLAKLQRRKTVLTRHHSDAIHEIKSSAKRRFYLALEDYVSRMSDHVIAPSRMVRECLVDREGVPPEKVSVIPYGQTTRRFDSVTSEKIKKVREELGMTSKFVLVCVSRLYDRKGHEYLFEALAGDGIKEMDWTLYLVGEGEFRGSLERMCRDLGIANRVHFLGWRDDALTIIAASDIVVHPSLEDALSSAVIEAVMLGRPIIATDISGAGDTLGNGKYGEIVSPADTDALRNGLIGIFADPNAAREKATVGRRHLLKYMDARTVSRAYYNVCKEVLGL